MVLQRDRAVPVWGTAKPGARVNVLWQGEKLTAKAGRDGKWRVEIFEDGINADRDATDYVKKSQTVTAGEKLAVTLAPGGGWTAHFVRKGFLW